MEISHAYKLCLLIMIFVYYYHVVDTADLVHFTTDPSLDDLKCSDADEEFRFLTPGLDGCVSRCLKHVKCHTVFYDKSQIWCQGCTSTDNTLSAAGTVGFSTDTMRYRTCSDLLASGVTTSGVYTIQPKPDSVITTRAYCDMDTLGGGWTVFQRRFNGDVDFYRDLKDYRNGFGDPAGEYWLGLKMIHRSTFDNDQQEVYLEFVDASDNVAIERYGSFNVGTGDNHTLYLGEFIDASDGNRTDGYFMQNNEQPFSTYDRDWSPDCPVDLHGGWWYWFCTLINPNGDYASPGTLSSYKNGNGGMINKPWRQTMSLKETKLMFRTK